MTNNLFKETFDVSAIKVQDLQGTILSELNDKEPLTRVSVLVKVVNSEEPITLGTRQKQEIKVSDPTRLADLNRKCSHFATRKKLPAE